MHTEAFTSRLAPSWVLAMLYLSASQKGTAKLAQSQNCGRFQSGDVLCLLPYIHIIMCMHTHACPHDDLHSIKYDHSVLSACRAVHSDPFKRCHYS